MYQNFFGFKEKPFKLVPNPAYLFLSRVHEEALAHLAYAVSQGEGFVQITGEVGTGKTTLCRAFLESLNETTEAAFIFNPKLDSLQLLKAINEEFGLSADADNTKALIDALNDYLIAEKAKGKNVVLSSTKPRIFPLKCWSKFGSYRTWKPPERSCFRSFWWVNRNWSRC